MAGAKHGHSAPSSLGSGGCGGVFLHDVSVRAVDVRFLFVRCDRDQIYRVGTCAQEPRPAEEARRCYLETPVVVPGLPNEIAATAPTTPPRDGSWSRLGASARAPLDLALNAALSEPPSRRKSSASLAWLRLSGLGLSADQPFALELHTKCAIPMQNHRRRSRIRHENHRCCLGRSVAMEFAGSRVRPLPMFFVFSCSNASSRGVPFAHVGPSLCAAIVPMAAEVINPGFRIGPHNGVARTTGFCLGLG